MKGRHLELKKVCLFILSVLLIGACIVLASSSEIRSFIMFQLSPEYARNAHFVKLTRGGNQTVFLLGTLHWRHLKMESYSLLHVEALIDHLRPDLVLVESRPEELAKDNWGDGPIEMPFASLTARSLGIEAAGMDWWDENVGLGRTSREREDRMVENILGYLPGHMKVLVLTGFSHLRGFKKRMKAKGYQKSPFSRLEKKVLFNTTDRELLFPPGMTHYIQKRIEHDRVWLREETNVKWRSVIARAIALREELLEIIQSVGERPQ